MAPAAVVHAAVATADSERAVARGEFRGLADVVGRDVEDTIAFRIKELEFRSLTAEHLREGAALSGPAGGRTTTVGIVGLARVLTPGDLIVAVGQLVADECAGRRAAALSIAVVAVIVPPAAVTVAVAPVAVVVLRGAGFADRRDHRRGKGCGCSRSQTGDGSDS